MVKKMLNQKMPKMLLNQPLRTIAMVLVLALVLEQAEEEEEEETEEEAMIQRKMKRQWLSTGASIRGRGR